MLLGNCLWILFGELQRQLYIHIIYTRYFLHRLVFHLHFQAQLLKYSQITAKLQLQALLFVADELRA